MRAGSGFTFDTVTDRASQTLPFRLADVPAKGRIGETKLAGRAGTLIDAIYDERFRRSGHWRASRKGDPPPSGRI